MFNIFGLIMHSEMLPECPMEKVRAINEVMNSIRNKWKLPIIGILMTGKKRYKEIENLLPKISPRMLSNELKDLELNGIITRRIIDEASTRIEYELTESGKEIEKVIDAMAEWGRSHRAINLNRKAE